MKRVRINVTMDLTEAQASKLYPQIQERMMQAFQAVLKEEKAEHIRVRVTGFSDIPLSVDAKTRFFREVQKEKKKPNAKPTQLKAVGTQ